MTLLNIGTRAKACLAELNTLSTNQKNKGLIAIEQALLTHIQEILDANQKDIAFAKSKGMADGMVDRLLLTKQRIEDIALGVRQVAELDDPIGEVLSMSTHPNGLTIGKKRVPLGIVGMIYEARPNVTVDAAVLCLKSSNGVILRGGSEAISTNTTLVKLMQNALSSVGISPNIIQLVEDTTRETATQMMKMNGYIDVLIPRGGKGLIASVVANATVPVIETGTGNCHVYVDEGCDHQMALDILINAKTQRPSVCNAAESLVVHKSEAATFLPLAFRALQKYGVEVRGCATSLGIEKGMKQATDEDFGTEYIDLILSVKVVNTIEEAIAHINHYNTKHSETIITNNYRNSQKFLNEIDAAAVYVNASTRFTDGFMFGLGAEIGISTQKIHARGPMGLKELTTIKYIIYGNGQIR